VSFTRVAEQRIREAFAEGRFDNLPNAGQPLNLDDYFSAPADLRMAYAVLKNAKCVPAEVELLNDMAHLNHAIESTTDPAEKQRLHRILIACQTQLAIALDRRRRREK
jgi:hypothetical protein